MNKETVYTVEAITKILPEKLKEFRKNAGLTTAQVGAKLNKTASAITLWETGKALPDVNMLLKLCDLYNVCDLNEFLDTNASPKMKTLARSEQELVKLWREAPKGVKTAVKTLLRQCIK